MKAQRLFVCSTMIATAALSGCGGGGGGTGPSPMTPVDDPCIRTADFGCISPTRYRQEGRRIAESYRARTDFSNQWGLAAIKAEQAYAHLELAKGRNVTPGEGVTVGLIDTGIDQDHPLFAGATIQETIFPPAVDERGGTVSHGTAVASVVAAQPTGHANGFHGVAWGADLKMFAVSLGGPPPPDTPYAPISLNDLKAGDPTFATLSTSLSKTLTS